MEQKTNTDKANLGSSDLTAESLSEAAWVARVVSSGPLANLPLLEWRSADVSLSTPIGARLYVAPTAAWQPIDTAPKDGTEILVWREDCGPFMAKWTCVADLGTTSDKDRDELDEDTLFSWDWFGGDSEANFRCDGSEVPTHWMPMPADPPKDSPADSATSPNEQKDSQ